MECGSRDTYLLEAAFVVLGMTQDVASRMQVIHTHCAVDNRFLFESAAMVST